MTLTDRTASVVLVLALGGLPGAGLLCSVQCDRAHSGHGSNPPAHHQPAPALPASHQQHDGSAHLSALAEDPVASGAERVPSPGATQRLCRAAETLVPPHHSCGAHQGVTAGALARAERSAWMSQPSHPPIPAAPGQAHILRLDTLFANQAHPRVLASARVSLVLRI